MLVRATLKLPDGRIFDVHDDVDDKYAGNVWFMWTDGNYGCDCNKSIFINAEHYLGLPEVCGETIGLVALTGDGKDLLS